MRVKEESEKATLKLSIQKTEIMASSPNILWQIEGEKVEVVTDFLFLGSKITGDGDCRKENICFLAGKLDSVLISKDITLVIKVHIVQAMSFQ